MSYGRFLFEVAIRRLVWVYACSIYNTAFILEVDAQTGLGLRWSNISYGSFLLESDAQASLDLRWSHLSENIFYM